MASTIKVDNVQNQPGTNIINKCGTTITLGASSDTIALAAGASQTGFGRTGTVDWITTPKVTGDSPITGVTGKGYFLNTTAGVITINLPAGAAGSIVSVADYAATWQTYAVTVAPNGSEKIGGVNASVVLNTEGQSVTFVYIDSTQGWVNTMDSTSNVRGNPYLTATGGNTVVESGNYKIHKFTSPGTFCVSAVPSAPTGVVDYLVVGGGGGGGSRNCHNGPAGAGAGGFRASATTYTNAGPSSPLTPICGPTAVAALPVSVQGYSIVVGGGGAGGCSPPASPAPTTPGTVGAVSSFSTIPSAGGGFGAGAGDPSGSGAGGSGGGGPSNVCVSPTPAAAGAGNTPPVTPPQGNPGGGITDNGGGGGGGAMVAGTIGPASPAPHSGTGGPGGAGGGVPNDIAQCTGQPCGSYRYFAGGGGGGAPTSATGGSAGLGGGGAASDPSSTGNGTVNTGGGGGGGRGSPNPPGSAKAGGTGGSGIVIIRYRYK